jgi:hypothetical protein
MLFKNDKNAASKIMAWQKEQEEKKKTSEVPVKPEESVIPEESEIITEIITIPNPEAIPAHTETMRGKEVQKVMDEFFGEILTEDNKLKNNLDQTLQLDSRRDRKEVAGFVQ